MRRLLFALFPASVALVGCPGDLESPERFTAQFAVCPEDVPAYLATTCGLSRCHEATMPAGALDLVSDDVAGRLSGKMAAGGPGLLIDPDKPEDSVLYTKLTDFPPFGSRMPLSGGALDDTTIACVLAWISDPKTPEAP